MCLLFVCTIAANKSLNFQRGKHQVQITPLIISKIQTWRSGVRGPFPNWRTWERKMKRSKSAKKIESLRFVNRLFNEVENLDMEYKNWFGNLFCVLC